MRRASERRRLDGFEAFFVEHERRLRGYALRRTGSQQLADELVAEVMEIAWRRFDAIPQDRAFGWLCRVAINVESNQRRSRHRRSRAEGRAAREGERASLVTELDTERVPVESRAAFAEAWATLVDEDRSVLSLVAWEALTTAELAEALGVSEVAARKRLSRARERLHVAFGSSAGSEGGDDSL
jgi:RNA polymerase sigma-70 factor (ECF subfamily)